MFVEDVRLGRGVGAAELVEMMGRMGGFMGPHLARALELLEAAVRDRECLRAISFTGNLVATGLRGVLNELLRRRYFDVVVTTCGALDHDIARTRSRYRQGSFDADDVELGEKGVHRLGNVFIDVESYGPTIEREVKRLLESYPDGEAVPAHRLCWDLGRRLDSGDSLLTLCWRNKIPVFVPGLFDGAVGYQLWLQGRSRKIWVDFGKDMDLMNELMWAAKRKAGLVLGGGISKHHLLWWAQFGGEGFDTAVYISTADEYDGSLSGARPREAITWHKVSPKSSHVFVKTDVTVALPLLALALIQRLET